MFSVSGITPLSNVPAGGRVHIIGVCGVAMAQLAVMLGEAGFQVSGSDKEFYPPMSHLLDEARIQCLHGYRAEHISDELDLVVIGNSVVATNPEVQRAQELSVCYSIFPSVLAEVAIAHRRSVVIAGTHGKTTTTALGAFVFENVGLAPSYFIGGVAHNLGRSLHVGAGAISVVEGDEYDSSFFAKVPKFSFYRPDVFVITSIEFDHADIYSDLESIQSEFTKQVIAMKSSGVTVVCNDDANMGELIRNWRTQGKGRVVTFGKHESADYRLISTRAHGRSQQVSVDLRGTRIDFELSIPGEYNAKNALAILAAADALSIPIEPITQILPQFRGVKRRQDVRFDGPVVLIEDFAHHPTAVRETIAAVRAWYPERRLIAVFEPRSNTSRRKVFQSQYQQAFNGAQQVILCEVQTRASDTGIDLINVSDLAGAVSAGGIPCRALPSPHAIAVTLLAEAREGDVILLMSNGAFGGLPHKLEEQLMRKSEGKGI